MSREAPQAEDLEERNVEVDYAQTADRAADVHVVPVVAPQRDRSGDAVAEMADGHAKRAKAASCLRI